MLLISIALSVVIISYYWANEELSALLNVSIIIMICAFAYVIVQMVKRFFFKSQDWWDWLYYIGLLSMMLPNFFADSSTLSVYNKIADYGTIFLIIPQLIEGWTILQNKKT